MTSATSRRLAHLGVSVLLIALLTSCAGTAPPNIPTSTPVPTTSPGVPTPPTLTEDQASKAAQHWAIQNEHLLQPSIGWTISDWAATFTGARANLRVPISAAGKQWLDGRMDSELVWSGVEVTLPPKPGERWKVVLTSESVTDLEYQDAAGQIKAEVPFLIYGTGYQVEGYETLNNKAMLELDGLR